MVFTNLTPFPVGVTPLTNISPLTYRDGVTFLEKLERMRQWLNETLVPDTNALLGNAIEEFQAAITNAEQTILAAKAGWQNTYNTFTADINAIIAATQADIVNEKVEWQNSFTAFMADVVAQLAALNDESVGVLVHDPVSDTRVALDKFFSRRDPLTVNVMDHGAIGDNVADDTLAIQVAANYAFNLSPDAVVYMPAKTFATTGTVQFRSALDASRATINYNGAGVAVILGTTIAGSSGVTQRKTFNCPRVIHISSTKWDGTSVGIRANSLNSCLITVPFVQDFEFGFDCMGLSQGFVHNTIHIQSLWANHKNLKLSQDDTGWCNSNTFIGGRLSAGGSVVDDVEHMHIYAVRSASSTIGNPNANTFVGMSLEAGSNMYYRAVMAGNSNSFINCRWEALGGSIPRVLWKSTASWNRIIGGYDSFKIVEIYEGSATGGPSIIQDGGNTRARGLNISAQVIPPNVSTVLKGWSSLSLSKVAYDTVTGEFLPKWGRWRIEGKVAFNSADSGYVQASLLCGTTTVDIVRFAASSSQLTTVKFNGTYNFNGTEKLSVLVQHSGVVDNILPASVNLTTIEAVYEPS